MAPRTAHSRVALAAIIAVLALVIQEFVIILGDPATPLNPIYVEANGVTVMDSGIGRRRTVPSVRADATIVDGSDLIVRCPVGPRFESLYHLMDYPSDSHHILLRPFHKLRATGRPPVGRVRYGLVADLPTVPRFAYAASFLEDSKKQGYFLPGKLLLFPAFGDATMTRMADGKASKVDHVSIEGISEHQVRVYSSPPRSANWKKDRPFPRKTVLVNGAETIPVGALAIRGPDVLDVIGQARIEAGPGLRGRQDRLELIRASIEGAHPVHRVPTDYPWRVGRYLDMTFMISSRPLRDQDYPIAAPVPRRHLLMDSEQHTSTWRYDWQGIGDWYLGIGYGVRPGALRKPFYWRNPPTETPRSS